MDANLANAINFSASDRGFSLFDDDAESEAYRNFKFWTEPHKDFAPAKDDAVLIQGVLYKKRNNLSFLWTEAIYTLYASSLLLCYKHDKLKRMTKLRFVCVEEFPSAEDAKNDDPPADGEKRYGFRFLHDGDSFELYTENQEEFQKWRTVLKPMCVFTNFHECYNMIRVLGKGNFARVYLAEHRKDGRQFAVKAFEKAKVFYSNKGKEALLNEISILQEMDHPNIIKVYEVFESRNSIYMVTEYLKGGDLPSVVGNERDAQIILRKMLEVLHYMHNHKKVMHRDLKPENILRKSAEEPLDMKLADFGLATRVDVQEFIFTKCGTPGYVAPEVFVNKKYNQAVDIFSVGVMMYKMLTGVAAFPGKDHKVILERNRECRVEFDLMVFKYVSPAALDLLKKLLDKDPFHRLTAMEALEHDFFNDTGNFMNVSPNTTPKINIQMLQAQGEEQRFNMDKLKKTTLSDKTPTNTDSNNGKEDDSAQIQRMLSGSSFVTREIVYYGNNENVTDSHENSFAESRGTLQKAGGLPPLCGPSLFRKESRGDIKDPMSPRRSAEEEAKYPKDFRQPSGNKKMDVYKQAIMNMHRISHSDRVIDVKSKGHVKDKASIDLKSPFTPSEHGDMDEYPMTPKAGKV